MILVDDMGRDWVSCYGAAHRTPNIDRLAGQGVRFDTAWATPICTPTRVELLTGRYPFRTGWTDHHDVPRWGGKGLDWDREITFARLLCQAGYRTAIGGKWQVNDFRRNPDALDRHGFDEHCMWTGYEDGNPASDARYDDPFLQINGERGIRKGQFGPEVVHEFLTDFVRPQKDRPFLVYYPMIVTHATYVATPLNKAHPPQGNRELHGGMITYADYLVGRMMRTLDELGVAERTLVLFTGDNGSPVAGGSLRGVTCPAGKGRIRDLGCHVPFVVRAPWLAAGGKATDDPVDFTDILPTLAELAGVAPPRNVTIDGRSFLASLSGKGAREWIYSQRGKARTVRDRQFKINSTGAFHDVKADPLEQYDVAASNASEIAAARRRLERVLKSFPPDGPPPFEGYQPRLQREPKAHRTMQHGSSSWRTRMRLICAGWTSGDSWT